MTRTSALAQTRGDASPPHIVDQLIEERSPGLRANPALWPLVRAIFYPILGYRKAVALADEVAPKGAIEALDFCVDFLAMTLEVRGADRIPAAGRCVFVANHPGGIADGIALWQALRPVREDAIFFANRDAERVCPGLSEKVIPVEWRLDARSREKTRETLRRSVAAFKQQRCIGIFPAGRMAQWRWSERRLVEQDWAPTAVSLARKFNAPIIPVGVRQRMSLMFYGLGQFSKELRDMTVFHELLAKKKGRCRVSFGEPVDAAAEPGDDAALTGRLRASAIDLARAG